MKNWHFGPAYLHQPLCCLKAANFSSQKLIHQLKAGQDNKYDITKTSSLICPGFVIAIQKKVTAWPLLFSDSNNNNKNWNIEIWYSGFSHKLMQWNKPKRSHDMDLGAKQVVLWRICSQLQCQSKMTEIPEEAFVMDCIEYDAVAEKINRRCQQKSYFP